MADAIVKCLIWDLDNTLWSGTVLEDAEVTFRSGIKDVVAELDSRGILQSVASRNDHDLAWGWLEKLGIAEYFVLPEINWGPKSESVRRIADKLQFAHSAVAFIDDQSAERAEVAYYLPEIRCYDAASATSLPSLPEFRPAVVTDDARRRRLMYKSGFEREAARESFTGPDEEFVTSLGLEMCITRATERELARVEELTLRTSQMNATGVHYSQDALRELMNDPWHDVLVITMEDKFGPHGAVGIVLLERHSLVWQLKLLATSCRVVAFGAGSVILRWIIDGAAASGAHLAADFLPTNRNRMMEVAYRFSGLTAEDCPCLADVTARSRRDEIQVLHMTPRRMDAPVTMRLVAPDLGSGNGR